MTNEEAIKAIKSHCYFANLVPVGKEALDMAIKALEQEPCEDCCNGDQEEKAKLCQKSYLAGMEHRQEPCEDAVSRKDIYFKLTNGAYPNESIEQFIDRLVKELKALQPVTPKQKTGHWINNQNGTISCSHCNTWFHKDDRYYYMRYCPYCTVKMAESEDKE